jgi:hypothetical protein
MISYQMQTKRDCGRSAVAWALFRAGHFKTYEAAYAAVGKAWPGPGGWKDTDTLRDDLNDWPDDHRLVIESLGYQQTMVTVKDILENKYPQCSVVVLVHAENTHVSKHWVVVGNVAGDYVHLHWGDGKIYPYPIGSFVDMFTRSFPNCAYTITESAPKLSRWQQFRRWVLGVIARWT